MSSSITPGHPELHLHIEKPPTDNDSTPKARCRMCTINGKKKVNTRWICSLCPQKPGLCSKECFQLWHPGYEILLAARPLNSTSAPDRPQQNQEPAQAPGQEPDEEAPVLYSAAD